MNTTRKIIVLFLYIIVSAGSWLHGMQLDKRPKTHKGYTYLAKTDEGSMLETIYVKNNNDQLVGWILLDKIKSDIEYLRVFDQHQRCGYGRVLLSIACERLQSLGHKKVSVIVLNGSDNQAAVQLYRKHGFVGNPDKIMCKYFDL